MTTSLNTTHTRDGISLTVPGDANEHDHWQGQEVYQIKYGADGPKHWLLYRSGNGARSTFIAAHREREAAEYRALAEYIEMRARLNAE